MIYRIRHLTAYSYGSPVASAKLVLRVTPREQAGQHCLDHSLKISPEPTSVDREDDFYGNAVNVVNINTPHMELSIEAKSVVEVRREVSLSTSLEWESVAHQALSIRDLSALAPAHFIFPSPYIQLSADVTRYARDSFPRGRGIYEGCRELMRRIKADFSYEPEATEI